MENRDAADPTLILVLNCRPTAKHDKQKGLKILVL